MASGGSFTEEDPCCWICLSDGLDAGGVPLTRSCSCRGSTGFAHVSCIVGWAENECKRGDNTNDSFSVCPICKQLYQNDLRNDLSKAHVKFVEREFRMDDAKGVAMHANAIMPRMTMIDAENEEERMEGAEICSKLLHLIEFTKTNDSRRWAHIQGSGYMTIATFHMRVGMIFGYAEWKESLQKAREYYEMAVEIYKNEEDDLSVSATKKMISIIDSRLGGVERKVDKESDLSIERKKYQFYLKNLGENHTTTINAGVSFAAALFDSFYTLQAERFAAKLHEISHRVHGVDHNSTTEALTFLQRVRERRVRLKSRSNDTFQAFRYDDDFQKLVVQGPIRIPRIIDREQTSEEDCANNNVSYVNGTPVIFHDLVNAQDLNGKIGVVRGFDNDNEMGRYTVQFQDGDMTKYAKIKPINMRIVFDLPDDIDIDIAEQS